MQVRIPGYNTCEKTLRHMRALNKKYITVIYKRHIRALNKKTVGRATTVYTVPVVRLVRHYVYLLIYMISKYS